METYKQEFIEFMVESDVLKFGDFTLKSGRKSPFFMNAGAYVTGEQLHRLGLYYARAIHDNFGLGFDVVFGPAYKGIPLSVITVMGLSELYGKQARYCSNRKEVKDHGDTGILLGSALRDGDRVVIVEDVTTSGKSDRRDASHPHVAGRRGSGGPHGARPTVWKWAKAAKSARSTRWANATGSPRRPIVDMAEVTEHLHGRPCQGRVVIDDAVKAALDAYYAQYGAE